MRAAVPATTPTVPRIQPPPLLGSGPDVSDDATGLFDEVTEGQHA
jgi:hypothetical protein